MTINARELAGLLSENQTINWDSFSSADWESLARQAQAEGVAPLAYWILSKSGKISALPQSIYHALRAAYSQTWKQNQDIFNELEILTREFNRADIPVVILKGACFALTIYPDIGTRPMGDLDLLVPAVKLNEAVEIAKALGYVTAAPEASPGLRDLLNHEVCLQKKGARPVTLEIHKSLIADKTFKYAAPVDWFWTQTQALNNARFPNLLMLTPAAQILYASAHAMLQHGGGMAPLCWFVDLDRLIRLYAERIDWDNLLSQAKIFEWGSALDAALAQTQEYFDTPIPNYVRVELSGYKDRHKDLVELLKSKPVTHMQEERQRLISLNAYGRMRLLLALIIPTPAYMRWRYGLKTSWALPIYYPIRWWEIFKDGLQTLVIFIQKKLARV
jgi:hypothetical protein